MNVLESKNADVTTSISKELVTKFRKQANTAKDSKEYASMINAVANESERRSAKVMKQLFTSALTILSSHKYISALDCRETIIAEVKHNIKTLNYIAVACRRVSNNYLFATSQALTENKDANKVHVKNIMLKDYYYDASTLVQVSMCLNTLRALRAIECNTTLREEQCVITRAENFDVVTDQFLAHNMMRTRSVS